MRAAAFLLGAVMIALVAGAGGSAAQGPVILVNSEGGAGDPSPGDGVCDTGEGRALQKVVCTLRAAIETANARRGEDTIDDVFTGSLTFSPRSPLPPITDSLVLREMTLLGTSVRDRAPGLTITAERATLNFVHVEGFSGVGILRTHGDGPLKLEGVSI